jgi:hypothetical protein
MSRYSLLMMLLLVFGAGAEQARSSVYFSNGFETNAAGWTNTTRVASGANGITSADGSFHGQITSGGFTQWGGYNFGAASSPFQEYRTTTDIFLNVAGGFTNDTRFDYISAISNSAGTHRRDFAFNGGFYNNTSPTGTGPGFVFTASNNAGRGNSNPTNPLRDPFAITTSGWYTFEHLFSNNGGVLEVTLSIFDPANANALLHSWTLSDPTDLIPGVVGGNRYGWFSSIEMQNLAIDNTLMESVDATAVVPEPYSVAVWGLLGLSVGAVVWRQRRA